MIRAEAYKQFRRPRTWLTLGAMAALPVLVTILISFSSAVGPERLGSWLAVAPRSSGLTIPLIVLNQMLIFLLPLGVALFAGEAVAGDAGWGSLRYQLMRPVGRSGVLAVKALVAAALALVMLAVVTLASLLAGVLAFGWRPLAVIDFQHTTVVAVASTTFQPGSAASNLALTVALIALALASTFAFSLLVSTLTRWPFAAVAAGLGLTLVSRALDNIPGLSQLRPVLPVTNEGSTLWTGLWTNQAQLTGLVHLAMVQGVYSLVLIGAAVVWFRRQDVLS